MPSDEELDYEQRDRKGILLCKSCIGIPARKGKRNGEEISQYTLKYRVVDINGVAESGG